MLTDTQIEAAVARFSRRGLAERETILRQGADERVWHIGTDDPSRIRKLLKRGYRPDRQHGGPDGQLVFTVPNNRITFRDAAKIAVRPPLSDEQRKAAADRFARIREARRSAAGAPIGPALR